MARDDALKEFLENRSKVKEDVRKINSEFGRFRIFMPEILALVDDIKPAARFNIPYAYVFEFRNLLARFNLKFEVSNYVAEFHDKEVLRKVKSFKPNDELYVFVSKKKKDAGLLMEYELKKNNSMLDFSRLLGYPVCCISNLDKYPSMKRQEVISYELIQQQICKHNDWRLNWFWLDYRPWHRHTTELPTHLIFHFPCKFDCKFSLQIGKKVYDAIRKRFPAYVCFMRYILSRPILFKELNDFLMLQSYSIGSDSQNCSVIVKYSRFSGKYELFREFHHYKDVPKVNIQKKGSRFRILCKDKLIGEDDLLLLSFNQDFL